MAVALIVFRKVSKKFEELDLLPRNSRNFVICIDLIPKKMLEMERNSKLISFSFLLWSLDGFPKGLEHINFVILTQFGFSENVTT